MGDIANGFIMAGISLAAGLVGSIIFCFYINTLENNTDKPKEGELKKELEDLEAKP